MQLWLCPLLAFLLGSIPFGLLIARARGIDIRAHGSGNIGATNVLRVMGKQFGVPCLILDALKGFVPVVIAISLIQFEGMKNPMSIAGLASYAREFPMLTAQIFQVLTGLCAILGHNYSPWVGFKGGKGIATSAGVLIALMPAAIVILIVVWVLVFLISRYVSLASIIAAAVLPLVMLWGSWYHGKIQNGNWNKPLFVLTVLIAVLAIWKHRSNIQRLRDGTEHRFESKHS
ncbi:MAG: glycerol-3-phosphate 1-O-acyltransferase PlsY [Luteolibacter sp.]|jgi:glycerol-3-phosphate acyltransferase PlsY|nr:glycerol-3-phosphate 1-O-acyltransferase PlsY [Luteolibacter sp.]